MTSSRWLLPALFLMIILTAIPVFIAPLMFFVDDAFFYPQVAYNIIRTGTSTFNTITPTNGYHPLWMILNIASMALARGNRMTGLHLILLLELAILLVSVYAYRKCIVEMKCGRSLLGVAVLVGVLCSSFWGMESHLTIFFVIFCGWQYMRLGEDASIRSWLLFGLLLGGMILARLDDVFVALALILSAAFDARIGMFARRLFLAGIPCCFLVVPYLVFNTETFGHPLPVSGAIKSCFPHISGHLANIGPLGELGGLVALGGLGLTFFKQISSRGARLLRALSCGVLVQLAYTVFFTRDPSTKSFWYYATSSLNCALVLDYAIEIVTQSTSRAFEVGMACVSLVVIAFGSMRSWLKLRGFNANPLNTVAMGRVVNKSNERFEEQLAHWITANLPPNARILTVDFPGRMAFFTTANIVPLDGLIGDYKYNDEIVRSGIDEFIARNHMAYYIGPICDSDTPCPYSYFSTTTRAADNGEDVAVSSPLYRRPAGSFHLRRKDLLLDINKSFGTTLGHGHLGVWRLEQSSSPSTR